MSKIDEVRLGFETAYIDGSVASSSAYRPQFVSNNYKEGKKVLSSIEDELLECDQFQISVAFITMGGITPLLQTLKELEKRKIPGKILTTNYLNFSEPRALEKLNSLSNITLKMYDVEAATEGFHTKGYIFKNWSKNGKKVDNLPTTMPAESHIYTAIWERETYQITYDLNGGSMKSGEKNPTTYNVDTTVFKLKNPVRAGYTFTGWSGTEITGVSDNVSVKQGSIEKREYKANWRENTYQITFILSGTEAKGSMAAKTVNYTENVTLPKCGFTCKGHSFKRWYTVDKKGKKTYYSDRQKVSKLTDVNGGVVTLYPEWEANVYNVTFDYGDGRAKTVRKTKYGDKYQFPSDPTRYGWEFKGWKKEGANTAFDMSTKELQLQDAKNITLYASWKANQKYSYRPSNSGNTYRVTDKHEYTRFTYYVDGNQTSVKTTGDSGLDPARYHLNMKNISYNAVHQNYSKMRIRISYKIKMVKDGYSDLRISYHTKSDNKDHTEWKKNTEDLKKKNGKTITCEYTLTTGSKIDVDSLTLEFDAHGVGPDRYDLSNLNVDITFE